MATINAINNKVGVSNFTVDSGNVVVTSGLITMPTTSSTVGQITINAIRFLHNYGSATNTFVGGNAGNFTLSAINTTAVGQNALSSATLSGNQCTAVGANALASNTSALLSTAVGSGSLQFVLTGNGNCGFGYLTGSSYTGAEAYNICIGSQVTGTLGESFVLRIGTATGSGAAGNINKAVICGINGKASVTSNVMLVDATDIVGTVGTTIGLGTDAAAKTITIGNITTTTAVNINTGTNGSTITTTNGILTANTGTGTISISTDATATTVNIGTGGGAKTVTLGSTTTTSSLALKSGTGDIILSSATGTLATFNDTGEITFPLQSAFLSYLPSNDNNVTGAGTAYTVGSVTALTEVFDQNSDITTAGLFTAPVTGRYMFSHQGGVGGTTICTAIIGLMSTSNRSYQNRLDRAASNAVIYINISALTDMDAADTMTWALTTFGEAADTDDVLGAATLATYMSGHLAC